MGVDSRESRLMKKELEAFDKALVVMKNFLGVTYIRKNTMQVILREENGNYILEIGGQAVVLKDFLKKSENSTLSYQYGRFDGNMQGYIIEVAPTVSGKTVFTEKELKKLGVVIIKTIDLLGGLPYSLNSITFDLVPKFSEGYIRRCLFNKSEYDVRLR